VSGLEVVAVVAAAIWLGVLSVVVLLLVRQVGVLTVQLERQQHVGAPVMEGLALGSPVPADVLDALQADGEGSSYLLVLGATCPPCRELALGLRDAGAVTRGLTVAITGRGETGTVIEDALRDRARIVSDPLATRVTKALGVDTTPFAFEIAGGEVTAKAVVRGTDHLISFVQAVRTPGVVKVSNGRMEAGSNV
jgi:hypothetical protein